MTRVNELLKREIGTVLYRAMTDIDFDMSAVTITRVVTGSDLRNATVMVSIRDNESRRRQMLNTLKQKRGEIQKLVSKAVVLKYTPRLSFVLDTSLEKGDHVLNILDELDIQPEEEEEGERDQDGETMA